MDVILHNDMLDLGKWWHDYFWRDRKYAGVEGLGEDQLETAFQELMVLYSGEWYREMSLKNKRHPIWREVSARGSMPVTILARHGNQIALVHKFGFLQKFISRLKNPDGYAGANFEIDILATLLHGGVTVESMERRGQRNKSCEFRASLGSTELFIEAKSITESSWSRSLGNISSDIQMRIQARLSKKPEVTLPYLELSNQLRRLAMDKEGWKIIEQGWVELADAIAEDIELKVTDGKWGWHELDRVARYEIRPYSERLSYQSQLSGFAFPNHAEIQKISENAIKRSVDKWPKDKSGILILELGRSRYVTFSGEDFREQFSSNPHLGGILVWHSAFIANVEALQTTKRFISNPFSQINLSKSEILRILLN